MVPRFPKTAAGSEFEMTPKRRRRSSLTAAVMVGGGIVAGCSAGGDPPSPESPPPGEVSATGASSGFLRLGQSVAWEDARFTVTAVRRPFGPAGRGPDRSDTEWLGVRAETCAGDVPVEAGWYLFAAHGPSSERYPAPVWADRSWPVPQYPQRTVDPGACVDGWLVIPVVVAAPVATVRLSDPDGIPLGEWRLPEEVGG